MNRVPSSSFRHPVHFLAVGLGSGAAPVAPGTWGTLAAVPFYLPLSLLAPWGYLLFLLVLLQIAMLLSPLGVFQREPRMLAASATPRD